jgi:hypothetical protein
MEELKFMNDQEYN